MDIAADEKKLAGSPSEDQYEKPGEGRMVAVEFGVAILIALLFFFIVVGIINIFLPIGGGVRGLVGAGQETAARTASRELTFARGDENVEAGGPFMARLAEMANKVNVKFASDIAWSGAELGMSFLHRDAIQTYERGRALVEFDEKNYLEIGENSLVVFQEMGPDLFLSEKRTFRVMVEGELRGRLLGGQDQLEVALPGGDLRMAGAGGDTEFRLTVNPDRSSTLSLFKGDAQVYVGGKKTFLGENYGLTIGPDGKPLKAVKLPPKPKPRLPSDQRVSFYRDTPPKVRFSWEASTQPGARYRFVVARDPSFRRIVVDEQLASTNFSHGNLANGRYYWRVHTVVDHIESAPSAPRRLVMVQDQKPPVLRVQAPPKVVKTQSLKLSGRTEPGARVYVEGEPAKIDPDGSFQHQVDVKPGARLIVVEAIDPAGNVSYATKVVNGKF
ncbi:MAG: Ig-like domain-containing protein [Acidiferrobacterales bacterium]